MVKLTFELDSEELGTILVVSKNDVCEHRAHAELPEPPPKRNAYSMFISSGVS